MMAMHSSQTAIINIITVIHIPSFYPLFAGCIAADGSGEACRSATSFCLGQLTSPRNKAAFNPGRRVAEISDQSGTLWLSKFGTIPSDLPLRMARGRVRAKSSRKRGTAIRDVCSCSSLIGTLGAHRDYTKRKVNV